MVPGENGHPYQENQEFAGRGFGEKENRSGIRFRIPALHGSFEA